MAKVYQSIAAVQSAVSKLGLAKTEKNTQQSYMFRGIDGIYNLLAPLLSEHGLCIFPNVLSREETVRQTAKGTLLYDVVVDVEYTLVSAEDGSERVVRVQGEAMDMADKATNKAMSAAYKYMCFQVFCIPTEGDNDADKTTHEATVSHSKDLGPASVPAKEETQAPRKMSAKQIKDQGIWAIITERLTRFKTPADLEYLNEYKQELREEAKLWPQAFSLEVKELLDEKTRELQAQHQLAVGAV